MLIEQLKALANEKRLKIMCALTCGELCQVHIMEITKLSQVDASRNIKELVNCNLVETRKDGTRVIYRLSEEFTCEYKVIESKILEEYEYLFDDIDRTEISNRCQVYTNQ